MILAWFWSWSRCNRKGGDPMQHSIQMRSREAGACGLLLLISMVLPGGAAAREMAPADVASAVETWVRGWTPDARTDAFVRDLEPYEVDGETRAYIAHLSQGGYCLCGANSLVLPVYFYAPEGSYDPRNPGASLILEGVARKTRSLEQAAAAGDPTIAPYRDALRRRDADWQALIHGQVPAPRVGDRPTPNPVAIELPLGCTWGQGRSYNDQCPVLTPYAPWEHVLVGCNATAMSQTLYYWQWPYQGVGTHTHEYPHRWRTVGDWDTESLATDPGIPSNWPVGMGEAAYERLRWDSGTQNLEMAGYWDGNMYARAQKLSEDPDYLTALAALYGRLTPGEHVHTVEPGGSTYDWTIIPAQENDPPGAGDAEAAEICYHASATIDSDWGLGGTGGWHVDQAEALASHFRYDADAHQLSSGDPQIMVDEIRLMRVVGMGGGNEDGGGHAWICHGYDASYADWRFLMNMGWYGGSIGWYTLDDFPGDFYLDPSYLLQVAPLTARFVGLSDPGDGSPDDPYGSIDEALNECPDGTTLILEAGEIYPFSGTTLTIDRPLVLKGCDVSVVPGG
ncbi:MAG: hypothetical protein GF355_07000 [Candidatus Eisenbacteria bacterium]|nr:hypothetical protein [Candidatus Eisenbacteria bacterium]